jgi:hypothetical protein
LANGQNIDGKEGVSQNAGHRPDADGKSGTH